MEGLLYSNTLKLKTSNIEELINQSNKSIPNFSNYRPFLAAKIDYWTEYSGEKVLASGVVYIPTIQLESFSIISYQHETLLLKKEAPSLAPLNLVPELLASQGYIVLVPDYLGYGTSAQIFHPYYDKSHSATSVIDFIIAATQYIEDEGIEISGKLYLMGFSEGGYVTLATQQSLERKPLKSFTLCAVAACAGGYDLIQLLSNLISGGGSQVKTSYIVFLLLAYNKTYGKNKPLSYYFRDNYVALIDKLFNGEYDDVYIEKNLTDNLKLLFSQKFYSALIGDGEVDLKQALYFNSLSNSTPVTPLRLYHGTADSVIPYKNTELTYQSFINNNSTSVSLIPLPNIDHSNSIFCMLRPAIEWFKSFSNKN